MHTSFFYLLIILKKCYIILYNDILGENMKRLFVFLLVLIICLPTALCSCMIENEMDPSENKNNNNKDKIITGQTEWGYKDGVLTVTGIGEMDDYKANATPWREYNHDIKSIVIATGITGIGDWAFSSCSALKAITIPETVKSIGENAFSGAGIEEITLPQSIIKTEAYAFFDCYALKSITLPDNLTTIGEGAFLSCTSLENIYIPKSVSFIGEGAFSGCTSLKNITVNEYNENYSSIDGVLYNKSMTHLITYPAGSEYPTFTTPSTVITIGNSAFTDCAMLKEVTLTKGVTTIGSAAFLSCYMLEKIYVTDALITIGEEAFSGCDDLLVYCPKESYMSVYAKKNDLFCKYY